MWGSVAGRQDADLCRRTVAVVESVIRGREALFRRFGIDSIADYRRRRAAGLPGAAEDPFGDVVLVIDGWATLRQEFDSLEGPITAIAAQGLSFGVHVVVTASRWAELRPAVKDQIATRIELRLGDPAESEMDRRRARDLSDRPAGARHHLRAAGNRRLRCRGGTELPRRTGSPRRSLRIPNGCVIGGNSAVRRRSSCYRCRSTAATLSFATVAEEPSRRCSSVLVNAN